MIYTTLNKIHKQDPCGDRWKAGLKILRKSKPDDEPIAMIDILDKMGIEDCLWCLRTVPEYHKEWRLFAVWCARQVQHLMTDQRSINALDVAERYANGKASKDELAKAYNAAGDAARDAAWAAWAAREAARDAARKVAREAQKKELRRILNGF